MLYFLSSPSDLWIEQTCREVIVSLSDFGIRSDTVPSFQPHDFPVLPVFSFFNTNHQKPSFTERHSVLVQWLVLPILPATDAC
jgi:hypothetical protein